MFEECINCSRTIRYQCTVRREIFEVAMGKFINIKKRRDLTADLKVRIDTGALNDFKNEIKPICKCETKR